MKRPVKLLSVAFALALLPASIPGDVAIATSGEGSAQDTVQNVAQDSLGRQPVFTPFDVRPEVDRRKAARSIAEHFRDAMAYRFVGGGSTQVWIFVDTAGRVQNTALLRSSGHRDLDEAALRAALEFEFTPARLRGEVVPAWIQMPISVNKIKRPYWLPPPNQRREM